MDNLKFLFNPSSVAIVGVSKNPSKLGTVLLTNIIESNYKGKIYPVNPKYDELFGHEVYPSVNDVDGEVDLVCIAVPSKYVENVMLDCAEKKVKDVIIITAGFREVGEEGEKLENKILNIAKENNIRILGPNCLGIIVPGSKLNASFAASNAYEGNIAFLSQSGAFCTAMLDMSLKSKVGFSHFVSLGNKADIDEIDLIQSWYKNDEVKVIGAYLEEIAKGQKLLEISEKQKNTKPLIIFKPGKSEKAKQAISSHTGSLAGSTQAFQTAVKESEIIEAKEVNEMFNLMMSFSWLNVPKGNRVAVITNAGGPGIIATDLVEEAGLKMADIDDETQKEIADHLPVTASTKNPIDVIGDALAERYQAPIDILAELDNVDAILVILTPQLVTEIEDTAKLIINSSKVYEKPIYPVFLGGQYVEHGLQRMYDNKIPAFRYINDAITVIKEMYDYGQLSSNKEQRNKKQLEILKMAGSGKTNLEIKKDPYALDEETVTKLANEVELDLPKQTVTYSLEEALKFSKEHYPVVIKATTETIAHKTDLKAIYLNNLNEEILSKNYQELEETIRKQSALNEIPILIQEQLKSEEEIFIGANRDGEANVYESQEGFGHLLAVGKGGIYTEIYKDIAYSLIPSTQNELDKMLAKTKVYKILEGARGLDKLPTEKVIDTIQKIQKLVLLYPEIASIDINPLMVTKDRAVVVDMKVFIG